MKKADYLGSRALKGAMAVVLAVGLCPVAPAMAQEGATTSGEGGVQNRHRQRRQSMMPRLQSMKLGPKKTEPRSSRVRLPRIPVRQSMPPVLFCLAYRTRVASGNLGATANGCWMPMAA